MPKMTEFILYQAKKWIQRCQKSLSIKKTKLDFKWKILNETFKIFVFLFLVAVCVSLNIVIFGFWLSLSWQSDLLSKQ